MAKFNYISLYFKKEIDSIFKKNKLILEKNLKADKLKYGKISLVKKNLIYFLISTPSELNFTTLKLL